ASVRADDCGDALVEAQNGFVRKRFEAEELERFEMHGRRFCLLRINHSPCRIRKQKAQYPVAARPPDYKILWPGFFRKSRRRKKRPEPIIRRAPRVANSFIVACVSIQTMNAIAINGKTEAPGKPNAVPSVRTSRPTNRHAAAQHIAYKSKADTLDNT